MTIASQKFNRYNILETSIDNFRQARTLRIYKYYEDGYSQHEIAGFEGISQMTVSRFLGKANRIIEASLLAEQEGEVRLSITIKINGEVQTQKDRTLCEVIKSITKQNRELNI